MCWARIAIYIALALVLFAVPTDQARDSGITSADDVLPRARPAEVPVTIGEVQP